MSDVPIPPGQDAQDSDRVIGYLLRWAQHAWQLALDDALRPLGIGAAGFGVLRLIERTPGSSGAALAAESMYSPQATHQILVALEARGIVQRQVDPDDARRRLASLTPHGNVVLAQAHARAVCLEERMTAGLTDAQYHQFRTWLVGAAQALATVPTDPTAVLD